MTFVVATPGWMKREEPAFDRWLRRDLRERFGGTLNEPLAAELLDLLPADAAS